MRLHALVKAPIALGLALSLGVAPARAQATDYVYDARNKLVEVRQGESTLVRFQWDAEGRLIRKIGRQGVRDYVYDGRRVLAEYDEDGNRVAKYNWAGDRVLSVEREGEGSRYFQYDGLGSVVTLTDEHGDVVACYLWDAWGNLRNQDALNASQNRIGYTGHRFDDEIGFHHAQTRHLDPLTGRFTTQDTYLGDLDHPESQNRFAYAQGNPTKYVDPSGHFVFLVPILVGVIAAELDIIQQEITQGKELLTLDPRKGVDAARAGKVGAIAGVATATGQVLAGGALAGTGAIGLGGEAIGGTGATTGSALIAGTVGAAGAAWAGGALTGLSQGRSLDEAAGQGNIAALPGAIGGAAGVLGSVGMQAVALSAGASSGTAGGMAAFAGGFAGDQAAQQSMIAAGLRDGASLGQSLASGAVAYVVTEGVDSRPALEPASREHGVNLAQPRQIQPRPQGVEFGAPRGGGGRAADRAYASQVTGGAEKATYVKGTEFDSVRGGVLIDAKRASSAGSFYDISGNDGFTRNVKIPEILAQANRQVIAAQGQGLKGIRWEVADATVAAQLKSLFRQQNIPISVIHTQVR
jgi:RHS repeat-associated protein